MLTRDAPWVPGDHSGANPSHDGPLQLQVRFQTIVGLLQYVCAARNVSGRLVCLADKQQWKGPNPRQTSYLFPTCEV